MHPASSGRNKARCSTALSAGLEKSTTANLTALGEAPCPTANSISSAKPQPNSLLFQSFEDKNRKKRADSMLIV